MTTPDPSTAVRATVRQWDLHPVAANALRTGMAVAVAWVVALSLPGQAAEYAYYAPLGAVIATTSNPGGSLRTALQAAAAITIGGATAVLADIIGDPDSWQAMAVTVGVGVLLATLPFLGSMGSWVPTSALFSLIFGDGDTWFVVLYSGLVLLGALVAVGAALVLPGQPIELARRDLDHLRSALARAVGETADLLRDGTEPATDSRDLDRALSRARSSMAEVRDARRKNQRTWYRRHTAGRVEAQLRTWEYAAASMGLVADAAAGDAGHLAPTVRDATVAALEELRRLLEDWTSPNRDVDVSSLRDAADRLQESLDDPATPASPSASGVLFTLRRTITLAQENKLAADREQ